MKSAPNASEAGLLLGASALRIAARVVQAAAAEIPASPGRSRRRPRQPSVGDEAIVATVEEVGRHAAAPARAVSTGWMLAQVTGSYRLHALAGRLMTEEDRRASLDVLHERNARRFSETSMEQGGAFLKVGQLLSARPDILPETWVRELSKLQDAAPAEPFRVVSDAVARELQGGFDAIDPHPVAAASIGQVHRAFLPDGTEVAVKVRRPGIAEVIEVDMRLLGAFLGHLAKVLPAGDYSTIHAEIRDVVRGEVDYRAEARAMDRAADLFRTMEGVDVPRPIPSLCSDSIITCPFVHGRKITTVLDELEAEGTPDAHATLSDLLGRLLEVYLVQVLDCGTFQADPHPGNFLVTSEGTLVLLDFGCTKTLPDTIRDDFAALMQAFILGDQQQLGASFGRLGFATQSGGTETLELFAEVMLRQFKLAITGQGPFSWPTRDQLMKDSAELLEAMERDPVVEIPPEFVMIGRVFGLLGGLFQRYRPDIDWGRRVVPHVLRPH